MVAVGFALFPTAIGDVGVAWSDAGLTGILIPEASSEETRRRLALRFPSASEQQPPPAVRRAMELIGEIVAGQQVDASGIALDMDGIPEFARRVYQVTAAIPMGRTLTYGDVARRVLAAGGKSGGFSAPGGVATKRRLLAIEGAQLPLG
jgi:methylated-DNA-[protein]-cysteine S-methyltransferase